MTRLNWIVIVVLTAGPWVAVFVATELDTRRYRRRRARRRPGYIDPPRRVDDYVGTRGRVKNRHGSSDALQRRADEIEAADRAEDFNRGAFDFAERPAGGERYER